MRRRARKRHPPCISSPLICVCRLRSDAFLPLLPRDDSPYYSGRIPRTSRLRFSQKSQKASSTTGTIRHPVARLSTMDRSGASSCVADGTGEEVWPDLWATNGLGVHNIVIGSTAGKTDLCQGCVCRPGSIVLDARNDAGIR